MLEWAIFVLSQGSSVYLGESRASFLKRIFALAGIELPWICSLVSLAKDRTSVKIAPVSGAVFNTMWVDSHRGSQRHCVFSRYIKVISFLQHMVGMGVRRCAIHWGISALGNQTVCARKKVFLTPTETSASCLTLLLGTSWVSLRWELGIGGRVSKLPTELRSMREEGGRDKREFGGTQQGIAIKSDPLKRADWLRYWSHCHTSGGNVRQGGVTDGVVHPDAALRLRPEIKSITASSRESAPLSLRPSNESLYCRRWLNHAAIITLISWFPWDL